MKETADRFTTRELSMRTFPDFEQFFAQVHGCACTLYFFGRHLSPLPGTAEQRGQRLGSAPDRSRKHFPHRELMRTREAAAVRELVRKGQAQGILVYADGEPVGWCHFGRVDELPVPSEESVPGTTYARRPSTDWVITCFTTRMDYRRQGVATRALKAAVAAIKKRGGGWIEAVPRRSRTTTRTYGSSAGRSAGARPRSPNICETPGLARRCQASAESAPA